MQQATEGRASRPSALAEDLPTVIAWARDLSGATELARPPRPDPTLQDLEELDLPDQTPQEFEPSAAFLAMARAEAAPEPAPRAGPLTYGQVGALGVLFVLLGFLGGAGAVLGIALMALLLRGPG